MIHRVLAPAFAIAFANLLLLGVLIGYVGASRAYSVGLHTLFRDHLGSVILAGLAALILAALASRLLTSIGELGLLFAFVFVADVAAGLLVVAGFGEITLVHLPGVVITETALGTQFLAVGAGGLIGYLGSPGFRTRWRHDA
jgi:hypothetical protein